MAKSGSNGRKQDRKRPVIVRREEVVGGGHHGGAWKVAYADFVTAMMAFFLLMWLLNATTQEQRRGLADYFNPTNHMASTTSGSGEPFGGRTANSADTYVSDAGAVQIAKSQPYPLVDSDDDSGDVPAQQPPPKVPGTASSPSGAEAAVGNARTGASAAGEARAPADKQAEAEAAGREQREFEKAAQQIRQAIAADPALADMAKQLSVEITPEGLRIQLLDGERAPMFGTGSAALNERARAVLARIAPVLVRLPEPVSISGHTDSAPYRGSERSNWDLSADRANATRRLLVEAGLAEARLRSVAGYAEREPLIPADPAAAANRRIAIVLLRERPPGSR